MRYVFASQLTAPRTPNSHPSISCTSYLSLTPDFQFCVDAGVSLADNSSIRAFSRIVKDRLRNLANEENMIRFPCPKCGVQIAAPEEKIGATSKCRFCQAAVCVPTEQVVFLAALRIVYDAEIEKDPDEYVPILAKLFEARRAAVKEFQNRFLADLLAVCDADGTKDQEKNLSLLASRLSEWRDHNVEQMRKDLSSVPDDDPLRCPISLFGTLGLGRAETAHTSTLAWLLHSGQGHGLECQLLDALLGYLAKTNDHCGVIVEEMVSEHRIAISGQALGRMDIFGQGRWTPANGTPSSWLLAIEAKIDANEGDAQLTRYDKWIEAHRGNRTVFRVFLTPDGRRPEGDIAEHWISMSFLDLVRVFRGPYLDLRGKPGFHFLRYYLTGILKDVCRWKLPVEAPESCEDPYGFVEYLKTVRASKQGDRAHASIG